MKQTLKRFVAQLPKRWQQELKRLYFGWQIRNGSFRTEELEYDLLPAMVFPGDWVLDIGANVGHYTLRLSELVGKNGRVVSFEPVPETFELLAASVALLPQRNVTLINAACSDRISVVGIEIPRFESGLPNYYMAHLSGRLPDHTVLCLTVDCLDLPNPVSLVKIDTEGHELFVLKGMKKLLHRNHPILIVEDTSLELLDFLEETGYRSEKIKSSSNRVFRFIKS